MECSIVVKLHPQPEIWPIRWSDGGKIEPPFLCFGDGEKKKIRGRSHQRVRGNSLLSDLVLATIKKVMAPLEVGPEFALI